MHDFTLKGPKTAAQFAIALALLITFSTGVKIGRHLANEADADSTSRISGPHFPYQLEQATRKVTLPPALQEVSAVSYVDDSHVALLQDEQGILFFYSHINGRISNEIHFAQSGDFEGLVVLGNEAWALRSDGDLYHIDDLYKANVKTTKIETFLKGKDDTEGLAYDAAGHQLLVGLKGLPNLGGERRADKRAVFAYKLDQNYMSASPFQLLDMQELKRVYNNQVNSIRAQKFDAGKKTDFQPSDLAVHPITGHIYHIAARGQLLVVSDRSGLIYFVRDLPKEMFRQPEGIDFDPLGNMFITNEAAGTSATLLIFRYQPVPPKVEVKQPTGLGLFGY